MRTETNEQACEFAEFDGTPNFACEKPGTRMVPMFIETERPPLRGAATKDGHHGFWITVRFCDEHYEVYRRAWPDEVAGSGLVC